MAPLNALTEIRLEVTRLQIAARSDALTIEQLRAEMLDAAAKLDEIANALSNRIAIIRRAVKDL